LFWFGFFVVVVLGGGHCSIYKSSYNVSKYIILEFISSAALLHPPSPDSWNSFNRYHFFIYIHVYTFFAPYSSSYPFLGHLSPPLVIHLLGQKLFCPPVFQFCGRKYIKYNKKNMEFLLV
jgi:hypothetical protein